jgi:hypothetical protein
MRDRDTPSGGLLLALAVAWLIVILVITVALPALAGAGLLTGAAAAVTAGSWLSSWRYAVSPLAGLLTGALAGAAVLALNGISDANWILAGSVASAALIGGALVLLVPGTVAAAGLAAGLSAFVVGYALDFFLRDPLMDLFGAGRSAASGYSAGGYLAFTEAIVGALVGGLIAYWSLRRRAVAGWTSYLLAGATPGILLLLAAAVTRIAGARLLALLDSVSAADRTALGASAESRVNYALVVLFVGAIVALLAYGRSLPKRTDADDGPEVAEGSSEADRPARPDRPAEFPEAEAIEA